jgi:hypothetical protein
MMGRPSEERRPNKPCFIPTLSRPNRDIAVWVTDMRYQDELGRIVITAEVQEAERPHVSPLPSRHEYDFMRDYPRPRVEDLARKGVIKIDTERIQFADVGEYIRVGEKIIVNEANIDWGVEWR